MITLKGIHARFDLKTKTRDNVTRQSSEFFFSDLVVVVKLSEVEYSRAFQLLPQTSFFTVISSRGLCTNAPFIVPRSKSQ